MLTKKITTRLTEALETDGGPSRGRAWKAIYNYIQGSVPSMDSVATFINSKLGPGSSERLVQLAADTRDMLNGGVEDDLDSSYGAGGADQAQDELMDEFDSLWDRMTERSNLPMW